MPSHILTLQCWTVISDSFIKLTSWVFFSYSDFPTPSLNKLQLQTQILGKAVWAWACREGREANMLSNGTWIGSSTIKQEFQSRFLHIILFGLNVVSLWNSKGLIVTMHIQTHLYRQTFAFSLIMDFSCVTETGKLAVWGCKKTWLPSYSWICTLDWCMTHWIRFLNWIWYLQGDAGLKGLWE